MGKYSSSDFATDELRLRMPNQEEWIILPCFLEKLESGQYDVRPDFILFDTFLGIGWDHVSPEGILPVGASTAVIICCLLVAGTRAFAAPVKSGISPGERTVCEGSGTVEHSARSFQSTGLSTIFKSTSSLTINKSNAHRVGSPVARKRATNHRQIS